MLDAVALNATLTAINVFYIVRLLRGRHDSRTFEVSEISPNETYLKHLQRRSTSITSCRPLLPDSVVVPTLPHACASGVSPRVRWRPQRQSVLAGAPRLNRGDQHGEG